MSAAVAGGVIAFYQLGYGIAAFGAGPLQDCGGRAPDLLRAARPSLALVMGGSVFVLVARPANAADHPWTHARDRDACRTTIPKERP